MVLFEECFAEFYDSLRTNFLYSQIMIESGGSFIQNIKDFFKSIIKFIQNLASNIKKKILEFRYKEKSENLDDAVKNAMETINSDPKLKSQQVEHFDCEKYQKNVEAFMKEVTARFDKVIAMDMRTENDDDVQKILDEFNAEVDILYKKYNLNEENIDIFNVKDSLSDTIRKTYSRQKNCKNTTEQQLNNWDASIKNMERKVDSLNNKDGDETKGFGTIRTAISKFCGYISKAINRILDFDLFDCMKILMAFGLFAYTVDGIVNMSADVRDNAARRQKYYKSIKR